VVAVTGSYGKTSTKGHIAHLVRPDRTVVATPASFNNRAGLARAVNEHLADGTEVFVAEMGTYGPGEIAELCRWCPPDISVITAIGPVHLERFGSEDRIVEAKSEILRAGDDVVLAVDDPRLAALAERGGRRGKRVLRCSVGPTGRRLCGERPGTTSECRPSSMGPCWPRTCGSDRGPAHQPGLCHRGGPGARGGRPRPSSPGSTDLSSVDHRLQGPVGDRA
jgi:hypothetical protein